MSDEDADGPTEESTDAPPEDEIDAPSEDEIDAPPEAGKPPEEVSPFDRVTNHWEVVVEDMHATAEEFRERGWTAFECHPGDVHPVSDDDQLGLDVIVSNEEYEAVREAVYEPEAEFGSVEVFRAEAEGLAFAVAVVSDESREEAVLVPVYYDLVKSEDMLERAMAEGVLSLYVRDLQTEDIVTFELENPGLFVPDGVVEE